MGESTVETARHIISVNRYLTLATADGQGPWAAPLAYVVDSTYIFYWISLRSARHSQAIEAGAKAAIVIFDSSATQDVADGLQAEGRATPVPVEHIVAAYSLYATRFPDYCNVSVESVIGSASLRFYQFVPDALYKLDTAYDEGTRRLPIDLHRLADSPPYC